MRPDNRTRQMVHPYPGRPTAWVGPADLDLVELGERVMLALYNENDGSWPQEAIRLRVRRVAA